MPGARVNINRAALRRVSQVSAAEAAERAAQITAYRVRQNITMAGRINTGAMRDSVKVVKHGRTRFSVDSDLFYTGFQEFGIGPVRARKGHVLRFKPKGSSTFIFRPRTRGFPGMHAFKRALDQLTLRDFLP